MSSCKLAFISVLFALKFPYSQRPSGILHNSNFSFKSIKIAFRLPSLYYFCIINNKHQNLKLIFTLSLKMHLPALLEGGHLKRHV